MTDDEIKKKQAAEQIPVPPPPPTFIREVIEENKKQAKEPSPGDDKLLMDGADSDFWELLKRYITDKQKRLATMTAEKVRSGEFRLEEIGFRYLIQDQVTNALNDVIEYVELRRKVRQQQLKDAVEKKEAEKA